VRSRCTLALALLTASCATHTAPVSRPIELVPRDQMQGEFLAQQKLRFRYAERSGTLDAVLQVHCGKVSIVGLSPLGTRLFSITQQGDVIAVESNASRPWPFPPEEILQAVHRTYLLPIARPARADGTHRVEVGTLQFVERWADGALRERGFPDARRADLAVTVRYTGDAPEGIARHVALHDAVLGYRLEIETLSTQRLECAADLLDAE